MGCFNNSAAACLTGKRRRNQAVTYLPVDLSVYRALTTPSRGWAACLEPAVHRIHQVVLHDSFHSCESQALVSRGRARPSSVVPHVLLLPDISHHHEAMPALVTLNRIPPRPTHSCQPPPSSPAPPSSFVLSDSRPSSLVLVDELGKGTEILSGTALAAGILKDMAASGAR